MSVTAILPLPANLASRRDAVFAPVAGQSPLVRIVRTLATVGDVVVAAAAPLAADVEESLAGQGLSSVRVRTADAPGSRADCIAAGLHALGDAAAGPLLLHDIGWPLILSTALDRVVDALRDGALAALPVCAVTDSIKAVDVNGAVTATIDRSPLRTVQYPRGFDAAILTELLAHTRADGFDDLDELLAAGVPVALVDGDTDTVGVELPRDADYLAAVIEGRSDVPGR